MFPENFNRIGLLSKTHGIHGTMVLRVDGNFKDDLSKGEFLFVSIDATMIPFFIEDIRVVGDDAFIKFADVDSERDATVIKGRSVFIPGKKEERFIDFNSYIGFQVRDENSGRGGLITSYHDQDENPLLVLNSDEKEFLIPVHHEFILSVDEKEKIIIMCLPEGIFDLND